MYSAPASEYVVGAKALSPMRLPVKEVRNNLASNISLYQGLPSSWPIPYPYRPYLRCPYHAVADMLIAYPRRTLIWW